MEILQPRAAANGETNRSNRKKSGRQLEICQSRAAAWGDKWEDKWKLSVAKQAHRTESRKSGTDGKQSPVLEKQHMGDKAKYMARSKLLENERGQLLPGRHWPDWETNERREVKRDTRKPSKERYLESRTSRPSMGDTTSQSGRQMN